MVGSRCCIDLFEPLGYTLTAERHILDPQFPDWGQSPYYTVTLAQTIRLADLLSHLYVLIPVLDDDKHYYVSSDEVDKLLRRGEGWLSAHPERDLIVKRYLKHQFSLRRAALERLVQDAPDPEALDAEEAAAEEQIVEPEDKKVGLHQQRLGAVLAVLKQSGAQRVLDLGCGEGRLLRMLMTEKQFTQILGMDVSYRALEMASERLKLERLPERQRERIALIHGSLMYRDSRLEDFDAAAVVEVIEHLDPPRLAAFERVLFECARPATVVMTTPNREYNVMWETLPAGSFRHRDHRFRVDAGGVPDLGGQASASALAIACVFCLLALKMPQSARRVRWPCLRYLEHDRDQLEALDGSIGSSTGRRPSRLAHL